jgi:uncharacterized protein (TIGR02118 family)
VTDVIKMVVAGRRRQGLSLAEFDKYWDKQHAQLALELSETLGIKRYVQSIRVDAHGLDAFTSDRGQNDAATIDFVAELWFDSVEDLATAFNSPEGNAANQRLARDEEVFCDRSSFVVLLTEERVKLGQA